MENNVLRGDSRMMRHQYIMGDDMKPLAINIWGDEAMAKKGDKFRCIDCGIVIEISEPCDCEVCDLICCDVPMVFVREEEPRKKAKAKKKPAKKKVSKKK
jgi:hypothetical protein